MKVITPVLLLAVALHAAAEQRGPGPTKPPIRLVGAPAGFDGGLTILASRPENPSDARLETPESISALERGWWVLTPLLVGYWGAPVQIELPLKEAISLRVWPEGRIRIPLLGLPVGTSRGDLTFRSSPGQLPDVPRYTTPCPITATEAVCVLPSGVLDLEFRVGNLVPLYLWDVSSPAGGRTAKLAAAVLRSGASVSGRVVDQRGKPILGAEVRLSDPRGEPISDDSGEKYGIVARSNARGYFQIVNPPAGEYRALARYQAFSSHGSLLVVFAGQEKRFGEDLVLRPPRTLRAIVNPPTDAQGKLWLVRAFFGEGRFPSLAYDLSPVARDGTWVRERAPCGKYRLELHTTSGLWSRLLVDHCPGPDDSGEGEDLAFTLQTGYVVGRVKAGSRPITGHVVLVNRSSGTRVSLSSSDAGEFEGPFPMGSESDKWSVWIQSEDPFVQRHLDKAPMEMGTDGRYQLDIKLPGASIVGSVVTEQGAPWPNDMIIVAAANSDDQPLTQAKVRASARGSFELFGLPEGVHRVTAQAKGGYESAGQDVNVRPDAKAQITLVLEKAKSLTGYVLSTAGGPVAGAEIVVRAPGAAFASPTKTNGGGHFQTRVAAQADAVLFTADAPGYAHLMGRLSANDIEKPVRIELTQMGGTLRLVSDGAAFPGSVVSSRGGDESVGMLMRWARRNNSTATPSSPNEVVVPMMAAGDYSYCEAGRPNGTLRRPRCAAGYLTAGGELTLRLPAN